MPVTSSALKALRRDQRRAETNRPVKSRMLSTALKLRKKPSAENLKNAFSALDRARKKHLINQSKVNRLKSRFAKLLESSQKK